MKVENQRYLFEAQGVTNGQGTFFKVSLYDKQEKYLIIKEERDLDELIKDRYAQLEDMLQTSEGTQIKLSFKFVRSGLSLRGRALTQNEQIADEKLILVSWSDMLKELLNSPTGALLSPNAFPKNLWQKKPLWAQG